MGCDIHPHMELKINGKWFYVGEVAHGRNYNLFGHLSGVRGDDDKYFDTEYDGVYLPRDVSNDVSKEYEGWEGDAHTLTIVTFNGLIGFIEEREADLLDGLQKRHSSPHAWLKLMRKLIKFGVEDTRLIIWYDN